MPQPVQHGHNGHQRQEEVPVPQDQEYLVVKDVEGQDADGVESLQSSGRAVDLPSALENV